MRASVEIFVIRERERAFREVCVKGRGAIREKKEAKGFSFFFFRSRNFPFLSSRLLFIVLGLERGSRCREGRIERVLCKKGHYRDSLRSFSFLEIVDQKDKGRHSLPLNGNKKDPTGDIWTRPIKSFFCWSFIIDALEN